MPWIISDKYYILATLNFEFDECVLLGLVNMSHTTDRVDSVLVLLWGKVTQNCFAIRVFSKLLLTKLGEKKLLLMLDLDYINDILNTHRVILNAISTVGLEILVLSIILQPTKNQFPNVANISHIQSKYCVL